MEIGQPTEVSGGIDDIEAGAGAVWSLDTVAGVVVPIDPTTGGVGAPVRVGVRPTDLASGFEHSGWQTTATTPSRRSTR